MKATIDDLKSTVLELEDDQILVFRCDDAKERNAIHNMLYEWKGLRWSAGLTVDCWDGKDGYLISCGECDNKVIAGEYHLGFMPNNKDEYYTGTCKKCGYIVDYECHYDDHSGYVRYHNAIAIGKYFNHYFWKELDNKSSYEDKSREVWIATINRHTKKKELGEILKHSILNCV